MYIVIAILAFGILIAIHELGHFTAAKIFGVRVNEYSIGMGPAIIKKQGKETLYALRLLPIGGFCAMEGEDEDSDDPRSFPAQKIWKRLIILAAGPFMNFIAGFIIILIIFSSAAAFGSNEVAELADGFPNNGAESIMVGDRIYSINGERIYYSADFSLFMRQDTDGYVDLVVLRGGEKLSIENFPLSLREYTENDGTVRTRYGVSFELIRANAIERFKYSCYQAFNFVRLIRVSLVGLFSGVFGIRDLSGPVGIVSTINEVAQNSATVSYALENVAYLCALVAVNLAVMNLLPIPALDGGRIFMIIVTWIIEKISRRRVNPKYEGFINTAGLVLLLGLMAFVFVNDVIKVING